jgi:hypothetical protein
MAVIDELDEDEDEDEDDESLEEDAEATEKSSSEKGSLPAFTVAPEASD